MKVSGNDEERQPFIGADTRDRSPGQDPEELPLVQVTQEYKIRQCTRKSWRTRIIERRETIILLVAIFILVRVLVGFSTELWRTTWGSCTSGNHSLHKPTAPPLGVPDNIQHSWAQYSPYHAVQTYRDPPKGCKIDQVNIIQRHGARYPTENAGKKIQHSVEKLKSATEFKDPTLHFLKDFEYDFGHDDLLPFGAAQSFDSGLMHFARYEDLFVNASLPFVRASGSTRVIDSATNWTLGFSVGSHRKYNPFVDLIIPESGNNTLDDTCPNAGDGEDYKGIWQAIYAARLISWFEHTAPGSNLGNDDISQLISLCPYDTMIKQKPSPFCSLFNQSHFNGYEYAQDIDEYYSKGYGQRLGPVQGVGYVNELLARLTSSPVRDHTQTNRTLDGSPETFPLDRTFYIDFSHDNLMVAMYAALGLFRDKDPLDVTLPDHGRHWVASKLVPFSAQMVTERLDCDGEPFVRILVNDALQPLEFCGADEDGMCTLEGFVESQSYARNDGEGDWEKCFK